MFVEVRIYYVLCIIVANTFQYPCLPIDQRAGLMITCVIVTFLFLMGALHHIQNGMYAEKNKIFCSYKALI